MAKVIAHGSSREEARRRLLAALEDFVVLGLETNRRFLARCLSHPAFIRGDVSTGFIAAHFPAAQRARPAPSATMLALAAVLIDDRARFRGSAMLGHWRSGGEAATPMLLRTGDQSTPVEVIAQGARRYVVRLGGESHDVELLAVDGPQVRFLADGLAAPAHAAWDGDALHLSQGGVTAVFADVLLAERGAGAGAGSGAEAGRPCAARPMPRHPRGHEDAARDPRAWRWQGCNGARRRGRPGGDAQAPRRDRRGPDSVRRVSDTDLL
jgi:geranyl-CoA carboxylase alpha subunit